MIKTPRYPDECRKSYTSETANRIGRIHGVDDKIISVDSARKNNRRGGTSRDIEQSDDLMFSFDSSDFDKAVASKTPSSCPLKPQNQSQVIHRTHSSFPIEKPKKRSLHQSNSVFDPNSASPASDFIRLLQLRMSVYYEQEINMFY